MVIFPRSTIDGEIKKENKYLTLFLIITVPFVVAVVIDILFVHSRVPFYLGTVIGSSFLIIAVIYFKNKN